jgi:hypothetical protein
MQDALDGTHRLQDDLRHQDADPVTAAAQAFGDLTQLQNRCPEVHRQPGLPTHPVAGSIDGDDSWFEAQPLTRTQVDSIRAG